MPIRIKGPQDFFAGLLFLAIAGFFIFLGRDLPMGTASRMGAGYTPFLICLILMVAGTGLLIRGLRVEGARVGAWRLRKTLTIAGSVLLFAAALRPLGLVLTTFVVVGLASSAIGRPRPIETLAVALVMAAACSALFVYGLRVMIPLWPIFLR